MKNTRRNVMKYHYGARLSLIFMILAPIFGLIVLLSVLGVLPKFPMTENMENIVGYLIFTIAILIAAFCYFVINSTVNLISSIIEYNNQVEATIVKCIPNKHNLTLVYQFEYNGYQHEHTINVAKLMKSKSKFAKGTTHNVYVMKKQDQVKSALFIFA